MEFNEAWSQAVELGPSATQPAVIGQTLYHLAGAFLWRVGLSRTGAIEEDPKALGRKPGARAEAVNALEKDHPLVSQSTPSFSQASGLLYFGTAYGRLWAYDTRQDRLDRFELEIGCPIVGAPLIVRAFGEEFVVVADRPDFPGETHNGRPPCPRSHGKVWLVWNMDDRNTTPKKVAYDGQDFGGYITPSAVPGPLDEDGHPTLLIGADGYNGGRAIKLRIEPDGTGGYQLRSLWHKQGTAGFAGNFVSDGKNAYWLDTAGRLWGVALDDGRPPLGWPDNTIDIPALIGGEPAFTNTEPAVEVREDGTHLYITLRNYGSNPQSGPGGTGKAGAVVAIGPDGQLKWYHRFGPDDAYAEAPGQSPAPASVNTAPLALTGSGVLLFGDVNGKLYSFALDSARRDGGSPLPFFAAPAVAGATNSPGSSSSGPFGQAAPHARHTLLKDGEIPDRGQFAFSQVSGVGTDPAYGAGLILVGVNYVEGGEHKGRLVAYRVGSVYNLAWVRPPHAVDLAVGKDTVIENYVIMQSYTLDGQSISGEGLIEACGASPWIYWYLADSEGRPVRDLWPKVPVPADLRSGEAKVTRMSILAQQGDPRTGYIVGVIDLPGVMALAGEAPADPRVAEVVAAGQRLGLTPQLACPPGKRTEAWEAPGKEGALSGLADNILKIPYTIRQAKPDPEPSPEPDPVQEPEPDPRPDAEQEVIHDCRVASLITPRSPVASNRVEYVVGLNYQTNSGAPNASGRVRVWARPNPGSPPPADAWKSVTIAAGTRSLMLDGAFAHLPYGSWEIVAEVSCSGDTNPGNNQMVVSLVVVEPGRNEVPGYGSALTD